MIWHLEDYVPTAQCYQYNIICSLESHERNHKPVNDEASSGGGRTLSSNTKER